ncbi:MAG: UdgX family uracil-DNA binding protein [Frankia sp.]|nr:UdgX family uracil-DNA binding protein [Frankia sp.]
MTTQSTDGPTRTAATSAAPWVPRGADLPTLAAAAASCAGCGLHQLADTRTVFGEGPPDARMALVGEQPGDIEDRRGRPFVGPAGKLLDRALHEAGLDRDQLYLTNAVKHFRYRRGAGPRRIHQTPDAAHVRACRPWLAAELNLIRPAIVVILGATAGQAIIGPSFRVTRMRGQLLPGPPGSGAQLLATLHPSAVLRVDPPGRDAAFAGLVADLAKAATALAAVTAQEPPSTTSPTSA